MQASARRRSARPIRAASRSIRASVASASPRGSRDAGKARQDRLPGSRPPGRAHRDFNTVLDGFGKIAEQLDYISRRGLKWCSVRQPPPIVLGDETVPSAMQISASCAS